MKNLNLYKHVFDILRDQIHSNTATQLSNKIFQCTIIDIDASLNTNL